MATSRQDIAKLGAVWHTDIEWYARAVGAGAGSGHAVWLWAQSGGPAVSHALPCLGFHVRLARHAARHAATLAHRASAACVACQPSSGTRALLIFAGSYVALWILAAVPLTAFAWWVGSTLPQPAGLALLLAVALGWSETPYAQRARNYCHRFQRVRAAGVRADLDCGRYGLTLPVACCAVCWPWMLIPLLVGEWHAAAMIAVTLWQLADRLHPPRRAMWQVPPVLDPLLVAITNRAKSARLIQP